MRGKTKAVNAFIKNNYSISKSIQAIVFPRKPGVARPRRGPGFQTCLKIRPRPQAQNQA
jgi:hypothetical protein